MLSKPSLSHRLSTTIPLVCQLSILSNTALGPHQKRADVHAMLLLLYQFPSVGHYVKQQKTKCLILEKVYYGYLKVLLTLVVVHAS